MKLSVSVNEHALPHTAEHLVIFASEASSSTITIPTLSPEMQVWMEKRLAAHRFTGKNGQIVTLDTGTPYGSVSIVGIGKPDQFNTNKLRDLMAQFVRAIRSQKITSYAVSYDPIIGSEAAEIGETIAVATHLADYSFTRYKSDDPDTRPTRIDSVELVISPDQDDQEAQFLHGLQRGTAIANGTILTRDYVNEPASHFSPEQLAQAAQQIADASNGTVSVEILDEEDCAKLKMGAYLGVAQGSENRPKFIVLRYTPKKRKPPKQSVCFVGKSVTFDTGGYSLKPTDFMFDMKLDMAGGAAVLGLFSILSQWDEDAYGRINYTVTGILPACENMISGKAYRPGDIVTAMNGKTIEVINTDAEGRLTLADAISYADTVLKADTIIDLATLTGASMVALGTQIAALMDNDEQLAETVLESANAQGEHLWRMPLLEAYEKHLKSEFADYRNIPAKRYGDALFAGMFLKQFVGDRRWAHLDIAGPAYHNDPPHGLHDHGGTGYGVRTMLQFLTTKPQV